MLSVIEGLPEGLLTARSEQLHEFLDGPTLIHVPGRRPEPLFVSVLLHGNETTGYKAVQALLQKYLQRGLPRALSILVGNVAAARVGLRRLEQQPDYNRIWLPGSLPEHDMAAQVVEEMRHRSVFACIDVHNNTGLNPHYACVNRIDHRAIHLAAMFSRTVVFFIRPAGVLTSAFAEYCPAVILECGQPDKAAGLTHAAEYLEDCLHLSAFPERELSPREYDLFHTVATVKVPEGVSFVFGNGNADIRFVEDIDHMNFRELPANTTLAWVRPDGDIRLDVRDERGRQVWDRFFTTEDGEILTATPVMPSMLTLDERVVRQDCLCYLMERMQLAPGAGH